MGVVVEAALEKGNEEENRPELEPSTAHRLQASKMGIHVTFLAFGKRQQRKATGLESTSP